MANFNESLKRGAKGEQRAAELLTERGWQVTDVSKNKDYWKQDIDLIIKREGVERTVEVKSDNHIHQTGNIFLETITNKAKNTLGWFLTTEAQYLCIHDAQTDEVHFMALSDLREYIKNNYTAKRFIEDWQDNYYKEIEAWLVPIHLFKQQYGVQTLGGN